MQKTITTIALGFLIAWASGAEAQDAQSWCKSKWGADDEKGAANILSAQLALDAVKLVQTGKVYPLGLETNSKTPAYPPRTFNITILQPGQTGGNGLGPTKTTYNDDIINGWWASAPSSMASATSASIMSTTTATNRSTLPPPTASKSWAWKRCRRS
jgi:hypothetical protein